MAWTHVGTTPSPAHAGTSNATQHTITPPVGATAGDLVVVIQSTKAASWTPSVGVTGGQTWNDAGLDTVSTNRSLQEWWCVFNGTWAANPRFDFSSITQAASVVMFVFRPTTGFSVGGIGLDPARQNGSGPSSPFDVTLTGFNTEGDRRVVLASVMSVDDNTWVLQTGGWADLGPFDNVAGTDMGLGFAWKDVPTAGATGNVTFRQTANGGDVWMGQMTAWFETAAASKAPPLRRRSRRDPLLRR